MIRLAAVAARDRARLAEVAGVAARFGLGALLARVGLGGRLGDAADGGSDTPDLPARTRAALEALGPVWVKLGQVLATRGDLLPPAWTAELQRLQNGSAMLPFEALRGPAEAALGRTIRDTFANFREEPAAAASLAQVHRATLADGRAVAVKIRRPGARAAVEADLRLLAALAAAAERASADARRLGAEAQVRALAASLTDELDFTAEGRNADRMRADCAGDPHVVVPAVHWDLTSEALLVTDWLDGVPPRDAQTLAAAGIDARLIAERGAALVLDMVLVRGRFHADPHPGNLLCLAGDRIGLIDLGAVGHLSARRRAEMLAVLRALAAGEADALGDALAAWADDPAASASARSAAARLAARHGGGAPLTLSAVVADLFAELRRERLTLPPDLLLVLRALVTIDGVLTAIAPGFDLTDAVRRAGLRAAAARLDPAGWGPRLSALALELARLEDDAPRLIRAAARRLEAEPAAPPDPSPAIRTAGRAVAAAVLAAGAVVAAAIIGW